MVRTSQDTTHDRYYKSLAVSGCRSASEAASGALKNISKEAAAGHEIEVGQVQLVDAGVHSCSPTVFILIERPFPQFVRAGYVGQSAGTVTSLTLTPWIVTSITNLVFGVSTGGGSS